MRGKRKASSGRNQDQGLQLVPQVQPVKVARKPRHQEAQQEAATRTGDTVPRDGSIEETADGRWEVRLSNLPSGTSAKSLRAFLGDEVEHSSVRLDAEAGQAVIALATKASAEACLRRFEGFAAAMGSVPKRRRGSRQGGTPRQRVDSWDPGAWQNASARTEESGGAPVQHEPMESRGFSESDDDAGQSTPAGQKASSSKSSKQGSSDALQPLIRKIADFASRRRLNDAVRTFDQIEKRGLEPSVQAYASLINAYVNSGDMAGADSAFSRMLAAGLRSNVVVCTALLKGYCRSGDVRKAQSVLEKMSGQEPPVKPDLRLVNTLLRGCVRAGDLAIAESVFRRLPEWELSPDASSCCFMSTLLGQALLVKKVSALLRLPALAPAPVAPSGGPEGGPSEKSEEACRFWQKGKCKKGVACPFFHDPAIEVAQRAAHEPERLAAVACIGLDEARAAALLKRPLACKRALRAVESALAAAKDTPRLRSSSKERQDSIRRDQLLEIELIRRFAGSALAAKGKKGHDFNFLDFLGRCFLLPADAAQQPEIGMVQELHSWGLKRFGPAARRALQQRLRECFHEARFRWKSVFDCSIDQGLVHLELGAGGGEWVAAQAAQDSRIKWIALEIMRDRAHSILQKAVFQGLRNISIVCGEAAQTLESLFPSSSISHIFINFPEPPFVSGDEAAESSFHMMTEHLFVEMDRVLRSGCRVTILSDNARYMRTVAKTVASLASAQRVRLASASAKQLWGQGECPEHESVHGVELYQGWPEASCGHAVKASSYFDTLWAMGKRVDRFYMVLQKGEQAGGDLQSGKKRSSTRDRKSTDRKSVV